MPFTVIVAEPESYSVLYVASWPPSRVALVALAVKDGWEKLVPWLVLEEADSVKLVVAPVALLVRMREAPETLAQIQAANYGFSSLKKCLRPGTVPRRTAEHNKFLT